jgi:hypothetical protein
MTRRYFPPVPAFPSLRLASLQDVPRIAVVSTLGFQESEIFRFERLKHDQYPQDTLTAFRNLFREQISDPNSVVVVAEDVRLPGGDQSSLVDDADDSAVTPHRIVVGVCSWVCQSGSERNGQFAFPDASLKLPCLNRDLNQAHLSLVEGIKEDGERK